MEILNDRYSFTVMPSTERSMALTLTNSQIPGFGLIAKGGALSLLWVQFFVGMKRSDDRFNKVRRIDMKERKMILV
ncbi:hypothetical protein Leryth_024984 [Lithospermum erythrorhizon]|nr:hypothetical protein Leryth_024984 [Lithospermum erythrorhizon]